MSEFELSTEELARWLDKKYSRHGEIEDRLAAERLRTLTTEHAVVWGLLWEAVGYRQLGNPLPKEFLQSVTDAASGTQNHGD